MARRATPGHGGRGDPLTFQKLLVGAVLGATATVLVLATAREGPGATVDSGEYLAVAEGLADGHGFTMPYLSYDEPYPDVVDPDERVEMTQYPPMYPAVLAVGHELSGSPALFVSRWVNAVALGITIVLVVLAVHRHARSLTWAAVAGVLLIAPATVFLHAMAWSEPLMLAAFAASLLTVHAYLRQPRTPVLVGAVTLAALASLTRFTGIAAVLAVGALVAAGSPGDRRRRTMRALVAVGAGAAPLALWFVRNTVILGRPSEKGIAWHPPSWDSIYRIARTVTNWLLRDTETRRAIVGVLLLAVVAIGVAFAVRRLRAGDVRWDSLPVVCAVFGCSSFVFVAVARTTLDNNVPFDTRQLSAIHLCTVTGLVSAAATVRRPGLRPAAAVAIAVVAVTATFRLSTKTVRFFPGSFRSGYTSTVWDDSPTIAAADGLPPDSLIVTNAPDAIWLQTERTPLFLPLTADLYRGVSNEDYDEQVAALADAVENENAVVVFFERPTRSERLREIEPEVVAALGLRLDERLADGQLWLTGSPDR